MQTLAGTTAARPAGELTGRAPQVLHPVAVSRKTNRAIADDLFLSDRTVAGT